MSVRLPASVLTGTDTIPDGESATSSSDREDDQNFDDWVSDSLAKQSCRSLFDDTTLPSVEEAINHDKEKYGFDLKEVFARLSLDFHQRIRLINYIRKQKLSAADTSTLSGSEALFSNDDYLIPALEDDPLLQLHDDQWSDEEDDSAAGRLNAQPPKDLSEATRRIQVLEEELAQAKQDLREYQALVAQRVQASSLLQDDIALAGPSNSSQPAPVRDDDSHYFQSYEENDIHAVMIQDKVRTATYASFMLTSPALFKDAVVLDVGCGTGILSLFAARAGAKRVIAVDASDVADKARQIIKDNGYEDVITVIRGKVEEITLPDGIAHVDIIISEWMGYALLYESMLDSVLRARDRFMLPNEGLMAPSQSQMLLCLCEGSSIYKERVGFWNDIYGLDLSAMAEDVYKEAIIDVVGPETLVSEPCTVKDLHLRTITPRQLSFSSPFTLVSTAERRTKVHAFVLYFDTFFSVMSDPIPLDTPVHVVNQGDALLAEVWPLGASAGRAKPVRRQSQGEGLKKEKITSFSTGPQSYPTHWKQTIFLLREPIPVEEGTVVSGMFHCRKSEGNSRELDIEIHYAVKERDSETPGDVVVQMFQVR